MLSSDKISLKNDYSEGAHPLIIEALSKNNLNQEPGYGYDSYSEKARILISQLVGKSVEIHFVSGGTQANLLVIGHLLRPYESVISTDIAHIEEHETGAIEALGHKIHKLPHHNGKLQISDIKELVSKHTDEHRVMPRLIFLSLATEVGTVYTKKELLALSDLAKELNLLLYIDGARLAMALASPMCDYTLDFLGEVADVFYIGGTKNGALIGEAIVFSTPRLAHNFSYYCKQKGALLAKGRSLGLQFLALFADNLYFSLGEQAVRYGYDLADVLETKGVVLKYPLETNQLYPILSPEQVEHLENRFIFHRWETESDGRIVIRLVTSWATKTADIEIFRQHLEAL